MDERRGGAYVRPMFRWSLIIVLFAAAPAFAQFLPSPELENRIPAPLSPPPEPPVIYGPLNQGGGQGIARTPRSKRINSAGDKATRCLHAAGAAGLGQADADAYVRACVNAR